MRGAVTSRLEEISDCACARVATPGAADAATPPPTPPPDPDRHGATANGGPNFVLVLIDGGLFAHGGMDHGFRGGEGVTAAGPAAVLDAKDIERQRLRADGYDAVFADDAILLTAGNHFAGEKQQRFFASIYEDELVHLRAAAGIQHGRFGAVARTAHVFALFGDNCFARSERCIEGFEIGGVGVLRGQHRERP